MRRLVHARPYGIFLRFQRQPFIDQTSCRLTIGCHVHKTLYGLHDLIEFRLVGSCCFRRFVSSK